MKILQRAAFEGCFGFFNSVSSSLVGHAAKAS